MRQAFCRIKRTFCIYKKGTEIWLPELMAKNEQKRKRVKILKWKNK